MAKNFVKILFAYTILVISLLTLVAWKEPAPRAAAFMTWGLIFFWIVVGGSLMYRWRERIKNKFLRLPGHWSIKFILFSLLLILIEEAITTTMTNLAPMFGVRIGEAYITASANYLDVVLFHSVVAISGMFVGWAWMLSKYDFKPFEVFLIFGITGLLAEFIYGGPQSLLQFGLWIFVYGLMVYLPAYCLPERNLPRPSFLIYLAAIFLPFLFSIPVILISKILAPTHPSIHF